MAFISGASRGVGLALVDRLLRTTALTVYAGSRSAPDSNALRALRDVYGPRLRPVSLDVTDAKSIAAAAAEMVEPCKLLVHVAAIMHPSGRGENTVRRLDQADMQTVLNTNVVGPALLTGALYERLREAQPKLGEPAKVVAVGAGVGSVSTNAAGGWYSYRISKTALNALVKNLAVEGARHFVLAYSLYPEMVDTEFAKPYVKGNPYPTLRTPNEVAERMLDLTGSLGATDSGRFINIWSKEDIPY
ncbi:hypothetical protein M885DRAFT_531918 [Pelagophyceae sp. CCMP2097]|nr:hypothetical protein M885DRAFT_531918 [Pelagophyceae sp. CCMP2097]|mmetsp:Transcript_9971/g.34469  ORF Transcript_9971/g.34469 Transcript_9971/m.34469 type:complete len:246 (+) Transcript_9971:148-885(+)